LQKSVIRDYVVIFRSACKQFHVSGHHSWYKLASYSPGTKERLLKPYELEVAAVCTSETSKQITHITRCETQKMII